MDSHLHALAGGRCALSWLVIAGLAGADAAPAQAPYQAPGAVALLEEDRVEAFPDNLLARWWLKQFRYHLMDACGDVLPEGYSGREPYRRVGRDPVEGQLNQGNYLTSDLDPEEWREWTLIGAGDPGVEDARIWLQQHGCALRGTLAVAVEAVTILNGVNLPDEGDARSFALLLNPVVREQLGFAADGSPLLTGSEAMARDALVAPITRYFRTSLRPDMGDDDLRAVSEQVAALIIRSEVSQEALSALLISNYDGEPVLELNRITFLAAALTSARAQPSQFQEWIENGRVQLVRILGRVPGLADYLPDQSGDQELARLNGLLGGISEILPPQLEGALAMTPVPRRPVEEPESVVALRSAVGQQLQALVPYEGVRCFVTDVEPFNRVFVIDQTYLEDGGVVSLRFSDYAVKKPADPTEYGVNGPYAQGVRQTWAVDVRELDWEGVVLGGNDSCPSVRIGALPGTPGAAHDRTVFDQTLIMPDPAQAFVRTVNFERGRASTIELRIGPRTRAVALVELLRAYASRLENLEGG